MEIISIKPKMEKLNHQERIKFLSPTDCVLYHNPVNKFD